jgi:putative ABC transport system ATP-binding protein
MMLELDRVSLIHNPRTASEVIALSEVSLSVPAGQFVTVVGANGAGKSSLVQVVSGAARPTSGRVRIAGADVTRVPDYRRARHVARVFDSPLMGTAPGLSIEDNLALAMARGRRRRLLFAVSRRRRQLMRDQLSRLGLGLEDRLTDMVRLLSAGQRQSLTMIMAGLCRPDVLLLDEHLSALDPATGAKVLGLTLGLAREVGCATLMVTHNMDHALAVGDRLIVMSRGRVVADIGAAQKGGLTSAHVAAEIVRHGDTVPDRSLLADPR